MIIVQVFNTNEHTDNGQKQKQKSNVYIQRQ